jgi:hypothetical protein
MNNRIIMIGLIGLMLCLMILPMVNAQEVYKQNVPTDIKASCVNGIPIAGCTCKLTIANPDGSFLINDGTMTDLGTGFYNYTVTFANLGTYQMTQSCSDGVNNGTDSGEIEITPSGSLFSSGQATTIFGSLLLMIIISVVFLTIAIKSEGKTAKVIFFTTSTIGFVMSLLYAIISVQQTLFGFESIQAGIETFWFVAKMGLWLGFVALVIIIFLVMLRAWRIKRGLVDE